MLKNYSLIFVVLKIKKKILKEINKIFLLSKELNFSNSNSKITKNTSNLHSKALVDFLNKKRNINVGSIKKNLMPNFKEDTKPSTTYEKMGEDEEDLEKMIDFIVTSVKPYNKDKSIRRKIKENNNLIKYNRPNKEDKRKDIISDCSVCKCKKSGCGKYTCNCLKKGKKCGIHCKCLDCTNK